MDQGFELKAVSGVEVATTPAQLITAIITEKGVAREPFGVNLRLLHESVTD